MVGKNNLAFCVLSLEKRCDHIADCKDKSDEEGCHLLIRGKGYNKKVCLFTVTSTGRKIVPVQLNIAIDLLKIVDMEETDHKIDFQFHIKLDWKESDKEAYHILKPDPSLNALSDDNINMLCLPSVIYDNPDQKELTRLGMGWEWATPVREGSSPKVAWRWWTRQRSSGDQRTPSQCSRSTPGSSSTSIPCNTTPLTHN